VLPYDAAVVAADLAGGVVDAEVGRALMDRVAELRGAIDGVAVG
jgi:hypothetical protein